MAKMVSLRLVTEIGGGGKPRVGIGKGAEHPRGSSI
jgi:hypothetical protein